MKEASRIKEADKRFARKGIRKLPVAVVINDDPAQLSIISLLARKEAAEVHSFQSADSALQFMLKAGPPQIIITDLHMPRIDGWRFCRMVRSPEFAFLNEVPILAVSATCAGMDVHSITVGLGANGFLGVPYDPDDFRAKVRALLKDRLDLHCDALKSSESLYRAAFEAVGEAMLVFEDKTGMIVAVNEAAARLYDCTREELQAVRFSELAVTQNETCRESDKSGNATYVWHRRKSGAGFAAEIVVRPFESEGDCLKVALVRDLTDRMQAEKEKEQAISNLESNLVKIRALRGLLHICANCKKIKDDKGLWTPLEPFLSRRSGARFSHSICPDCVKKLYPEHS